MDHIKQYQEELMSNLFPSLRSKEDQLIMTKIVATIETAYNELDACIGILADPIREDMYKVDVVLPKLRSLMGFMGNEMRDI